MEDSKSSKILIEELYGLFSSFKNRMEDPNFIQVENTLAQLMENQVDMKLEMRDLKRRLLDPNDGIVVATNKNTEHRISNQDFETTQQRLIEEHKALMRWKSSVVKLSIAILTASGGVMTFLLSKYLG